MVDDTKYMFLLKIISPVDRAMFGCLSVCLNAQISATRRARLTKLGMKVPVFL